MKQILDASNARLRSRNPLLLEMEAQRQATKPGRDKARAEAAKKAASPAGRGIL